MSVLDVAEVPREEAEILGKCLVYIPYALSCISEYSTSFYDIDWPSERIDND